MKIFLCILGVGVIGLTLSIAGVWYYIQQHRPVTPTIEPAIEYTVTFPEGWRMEEMALRLADEGIIGSPSEYVQAVVQTDVATKAAFDIPADKSLMGFLFPDTYRFEADTPAVEVIEKQLAAFTARTKGLTLTYDTVILASIVEREARFEEDRAAIAGVYANRLSIGMPLQADPTVQFAKATAQSTCAQTSEIDSAACADIDWWPTVLRADLQAIESSFNTYRVAGLPPEPICNPGLASLKAAAAPEDHDFTYFVSDADGHAHFAKTLAEHNANVAKYR